MSSNTQTVTHLAQLEQEGKHLLLLAAMGLPVSQCILVILLHQLPLKNKHVLLHPPKVTCTQHYYQWRYINKFIGCYIIQL